MRNCKRDLLKRLHVQCRQVVLFPRTVVKDGKRDRRMRLALGNPSQVLVGDLYSLESRQSVL